MTEPAPPPAQLPPVVPRDELAEVVRAALEEGELVRYASRPIRRAGGIGVWLICGLGVVFTAASTLAGVDAVARARAATVDSVGGVVAVGLVACGIAVFWTFSMMMLLWPLLSEWSKRRTWAVVTDRRVLKVIAPWRPGRAARVQSFEAATCSAASVARRRGASATLVLRERVRERLSDDKTIYEWDAIHGLPDADRALAALLVAREGVAQEDSDGQSPASAASSSSNAGMGGSV